MTINQRINGKVLTLIIVLAAICLLALAIYAGGVNVPIAKAQSKSIGLQSTTLTNGREIVTMFSLNPTITALTGYVVKREAGDIYLADEDGDVIRCVESSLDGYIEQADCEFAYHDKLLRLKYNPDAVSSLSPIEYEQYRDINRPNCERNACRFGSWLRTAAVDLWQGLSY